MIDKSIKIQSRVTQVLQDVTQVYSVLTCETCGITEEVIGRITLKNLPGNWSTVSMVPPRAKGITDWLLCKECAKGVAKRILPAL